ncbi:nicotinamidase/pyrazinamidase [Halanaerobium saccharolyticum]|uniref:nicotinamidase n=1 Tax=Halanaerobium saccharolyticum TaxID=43595 RepID=A0A4R7Z8E8_9FIRM|nr:bifunctional nicotinamidase/pyrazinamidase [Halanaerobium saccharolyticum]RAK11159.1 nicotinamidase/pyrazinamidase [Halanaerobium saccharolyticum]TDW07010.1 nicotinamidase/pyrazinamidase [Halanaerobium saccharolyticum]TDX63775.1 nicotinamidase/pyrazinamidase [Halanaerobium saccharolyticum]
MAKALLVVDLQNDFYEEGALAVPNASEINDQVNQLLESDQYKIIVGSQDWHPDSHLSFASNHNKEPFSEYSDQQGLGPVLWPDHCVQQSEGAEFNPEIKTVNFDYILRKGTDKKVDSYSAFQDNDGTDLGLAGLLKSLEIEEIDIVGLAFDVCVKYTAQDSAKNGFKTNVILEGTRAVNPDDIEQVKSDLKNVGVNFK